jgi:hypothetical protein
MLILTSEPMPEAGPQCWRRCPELPSLMLAATVALGAT